MARTLRPPDFVRDLKAWRGPQVGAPGLMIFCRAEIALMDQLAGNLHGRTAVLIDRVF